LFKDAKREMRVVVASDGSRLVAEYCCGCGEKLTEWLQHSAQQDLSGAPVVTDYSKMAPRCQYHGCTDPGQAHHCAPRYLFNDADEWPIVYLCLYHHKAWHDVVRYSHAEY
jgi:endo-alpha-1,4-polygalactosaminidase (GH114 family)